MAKITVTLGELSGSIAGNTFSRNKAGAYVRQKVRPTDAKTQAQMAVRARFAAVGAGFHAMNAYQKSLWNAFATSIFTPFEGRKPGVTYTGQQAFQSLNQRLQNAKAALASNPGWSMGAHVATAFRDMSADLLETPPTSAFSSNITGSGGSSLVQTLNGVSFTGSNGSFTINLEIGGNGAVPSPTAPVNGDPTSSGGWSGYLLFGSDVVEQLGLSPKNIYKNLLAFVPAPTTFSGSYTPQLAATVTGQAIQEAPRKSWYNTDAIARFSVFAINCSTGQTQLIGSVDAQVG